MVGRLLGITNAAGTAITSASHVATLNPFRYRGYYYDTETGLYYLNSRYYDPETGRFLNADGYVQTPNGDIMSTNMFAYCGNNPINMVDPSGEFFLSAILGGVALWKICTAALAVITLCLVVNTVIENPPTFPSISLPKIEVKIKPKADRKTKDIAPTTSKISPNAPRKHHIVAKNDCRAEKSRKILEDVGINPKYDPINIVVLPQSFHVSMHTKGYHSYITERLQSVAGDKAGVEAVLVSLHAEILARSAAGIRWD